MSHLEQVKLCSSVMNVNIAVSVADVVNDLCIV